MVDTGRTSSEKWSEEVTLDEDVLGSKSILQQSKNVASDPGCHMAHPRYRRDTVADSVDKSSEKRQATEQQQNI